MPFAEEAKILVVVMVAILILLGMVIKSINSEMEFERNCFQKNGIMKHTSDGLICIKKDALLK
jgi:hypothetical protein